VRTRQEPLVNLPEPVRGLKLEIRRGVVHDCGGAELVLAEIEVKFRDRSYRTTRRRNMSGVSEVTDASFDAEVMQSEVPVLIDFWAPWCGPCRAIAPLVDELAGEYAGKLKVVKMNVDDNPQTPGKFGVRGIPNLIIFKSGTVHEQIVGAVAKQKLTDAVDGALS
jgi:thioredoxin 1